MRRPLLVLVAACSVRPVAAAGQSSATASAVPRNRFTIEANVVQAVGAHLELERALARRVTVSLGVRPNLSLAPNHRPAITGADASTRFYLGGRALKGFYLGARAGYDRFKQPQYWVVNGQPFIAPEHYRIGYVGTLAGYNLKLFHGLTADGGITADRLWRSDVASPFAETSGIRVRPRLGLGWEF